MSNEEFIKNVAEKVRKYAPLYGICVYSPIIAQAILESGWGCSKLASTYHNYFGLKCGGSWTGKSVNMETQEEYSAGTLTTITDNFRVFENLDDGVHGYFEFINWSRYENLKGVSNPRTYCENLKADGYATSSAYVDNLMRIITSYNLTVWDNSLNSHEDIDIEDLAQRVIRGEFGNGEERKIMLGDNYTKVQTRVNEILSNNYPKVQSLVNSSDDNISTESYNIEELAQKVIRGEFGNGEERREQLENIESGLYRKVQDRVNEILE